MTICIKKWRQAAALLAVGSALAGCGGGDSDDDDSGSGGPPPGDPFHAWYGQNRIQASGPARTVEIGFDGASSYVRRDGYNHAHPGVRVTDLSYIGNSGAPAAGQTTQWLRFAVRGDGYFATQRGHLPIGLNFAQYPNSSGVEARIIFFSHGGWDCPSQSSFSIYFETRISGRTEDADIAGVKCAHNAPGLRDGVWYQVEMSANRQGIAYAITGEDGRVVSTGSTDDLNYPLSDWNRPFLLQMGNPDSAFRARYIALMQNREFAFVVATANNARPWSMTFTEIASGWR
ncbi:MAG: hypothetical protein LBE78_02065 [Burkholderiaceae bacterium]|jgi:hypothetical protein|nr:hypothetical protein [Burkholderiaceae bacterium]